MATPSKLAVIVENKTFGVEIECFVPKAAWGDKPLNNYHTGLERARLYGTLLNIPGATDWRAEKDGSLSITRVGEWVAVEIISPILKGKDGVAQLKAVCEWLNNMGAVVNPKCGLHVTIGIDRSEKAKKHAMQIVSKYEPCLYAITGTKSRENGVYSYPTASKIARMLSGDRVTADKYDAFNMSKMPYGCVEFRYFAGTTNVNKILGYVALCVGMVARAEEVSSVRSFAVDSCPIKGTDGMLKKYRKAMATLLDKEDLRKVGGELNRLAAKYAAAV